MRNISLNKFHFHFKLTHERKKNLKQFNSPDKIGLLQLSVEAIGLNQIHNTNFIAIRQVLFTYYTILYYVWTFCSQTRTYVVNANQKWICIACGMRHIPYVGNNMIKHSNSKSKSRFYLIFACIPKYVNMSIVQIFVF